MTDFSEAYARGLLLGIARYASSIGEAWSLCRLPTTIRDKCGIEDVVNFAVKTNADAIIGQFYSDDKVELFEEKGIIAIAQDYLARFKSIPNIIGENYKSGIMGAEYFLKKGFKNFAFYGAANVIWADEREAGFRNTVNTANPDFTFMSLRPSSSPLWHYNIDELIPWLISLPKPVAIMACDDNQAYYITEACSLLARKDKNAKLRIPEDIAILGVDNDETICRLSSPNLSSINQDVEYGGCAVAGMIDGLLKNDGTTKHDIVVPVKHLITRQSSDIFVNEDPMIAKVLRVIHERLGQKISVNELVAEVPMSRRLLEIRFRQAMGMSIYEYIMSIRIDRVAQLLIDGKTVSEAAFEVGFNDAKNISREFKKRTGQTPSQYREKSFNMINCYLRDLDL